MKNNFEQILLTIMVKEEWTIRSVIAQEALKRKPFIELFFRKLEKNGCAKWMIESLVDYRERIWFFNKHYHEISNTLLEYKNETEWFVFKDNFKNSIVRIAVEKIAREMANNDLGLDI